MRAVPPGWTDRGFLLVAMFSFLSCYCSRLSAEENVDVERFWRAPPGPARPNIC